MATLMEEIAKRRPIDRTAARVTQPGPKGYESSKRILQVCSPTPLPMMRPTRQMVCNESFLDLTGTVRGQLTVIGLCAERVKAGYLWVCRCVCGYYVTRHSKSLKNERNSGDRCDRCRQVAHLRRESLRQQGVDTSAIDWHGGER